MFPMIQLHFHYIAQGKGYDVQNLLSQDLQNLQHHMKLYAPQSYHLVKDMDSANFHSFLRKSHQKRPEVFTQIIKFFHAFNRPINHYQSSQGKEELLSSAKKTSSSNPRATIRSAGGTSSEGPHITTLATMPQTYYENPFFQPHHHYLFSYNKSYNLIDIIIKQCVLELIYQKRHSFISKMDDKNPLKTSIKLNVNDIRSFIHGEGSDPLQKQLEEMIQKTDMHYYQHQYYQQKKSTLFKSPSKDSKGSGLLRGAMQKAVDNVNNSSSLSPVQARASSFLDSSFVFDNPHVFKNYQLIMLALTDITPEDMVQLLIQITEILQLIPLPYLATNNYNYSYLQLSKGKLQKMISNKTGPKGSSNNNNTNTHNNTGGNQFSRDLFSAALTMNSDPNNDSNNNPNSGVYDRSKRMTIQKGQHSPPQPQQPAAASSTHNHPNDFYHEIYSFFHQKNPHASRNNSVFSQYSHHSSGGGGGVGGGDNGESRENLPSAGSGSGRNSFRDLPMSRGSESRLSSAGGGGSMGGQGTGTGVGGGGGGGPLVGILPFHSLSSSDSNSNSKARHSMIRSSILSQKADLRKMSLLVTNTQQQQHSSALAGLAGLGGGKRSSAIVSGLNTSHGVRRKTSIIPENQRKYGKPLVPGKSKAAEEEEEEEEDSESGKSDEENDNEEEGEDNENDANERYKSPSSFQKHFSQRLSPREEEDEDEEYENSRKKMKEMMNNSSFRPNKPSAPRKSVVTKNHNFHRKMN
jgi:hypothetical protein